ncbi:MAG TPA: hypothetical protein VNO30_10580 [Kofleriaceae bacterium]|nr:hypothetical protein [Kofleriaceae bacterium]
MQPNPLERPIEAGLLTVAELKNIVAKLPAEARSAIAWSVPAIEAALARLLTEPLDEQLVEECGLEVGRASMSLGQAFPSAGRTSELIQTSEAVFEKHRDQLRISLAPKAAQTADWALQVLTSVLGALRRQLPANANDAPTPALTNDDLRGPLLGPYFRLHAVLLAVLHALEPGRRSDDTLRARAEALAELAGQQAVALTDDAMAAGLKLEIFDAEPAHLRLRLFQDIANRLRMILSDEDRQLLANARLRDLR